MKIDSTHASNSPAAHFITFEGGEGSGKTTQSKRLYERLCQHGINAIWTREPGGSTGAEEIRALLVNGTANRWHGSTEALLMSAARDDHWKNCIKPALDQGIWVICDRFIDSTLAYQGYGKGISIPFLEGLYTHTVGEQMPHRTYFFDIPVDIGLNRAKRRITDMHAQHRIPAEDRFEGLDHAFHARVRHGFNMLAQQNPNRFVTLDATRSILDLEHDVWQDTQCLISALAHG